MRLRRVYETATEENRPVEAVALERFGTIQAFEVAKEERRILDEREGRRSTQRTTNHKGRDRDAAGKNRFRFTNVSVSSALSRSLFCRPTTADNRAPTTPSLAAGLAKPVADRRLDSLRLPSQAALPLAQSHTLIPSVMIRCHRFHRRNVPFVVGQIAGPGFTRKTHERSGCGQV